MAAGDGHLRNYLIVPVADGSHPVEQVWHRLFTQILDTD